MQIINLKFNVHNEHVAHLLYFLIIGVNVFVNQLVILLLCI